MNPVPMKAAKCRELARFVEQLGGVKVRTHGDHYIYQLPNGRLFSLPMSGHQTEVSKGVLSRLRRSLRS